MTKTRFNDYQDTITHYMYLGLLPFFIGALGPWIVPSSEEKLSELFFLYSTMIFVFLAGAIWATAIFAELPDSKRHLHAAIVFSLWPLAAYFLPILFSIGFMMVGYLLLLFWEKCFINAAYAEWYQKMRHKITFIAVACHMLMLFNLLRPA